MMNDTLMKVLSLLSALLFGAMLSEFCDTPSRQERLDIGRDTQRCEVAGEQHRCLQHSARATHDGAVCVCMSPDGARVEYRMAE